MPLPVIETPRLWLRGWRDGDVDDWARMSADQRVMEFYPGTYDRARAESTAARMRAQLEQDGYGLWAVELKHDGRFGGIIGIEDIPYDVPFTPRREIGWRLAFDAWGHGYATEGATAALDFAFNRAGWDEVVAMTSLLNVRSQRVMQRLGMTRDLSADFDHPRVPDGHRLKRHLLYRIHRPAP